MSLNFLSNDARRDYRRHDAVQTMRQWMVNRPSIPRDVRMALLFLVPDLKSPADDDIEHPQDFEG